MSFGKAALKRFNDFDNHAPAVGSYDPKDGKKIGGCVMEKGERFRCPKDSWMDYSEPQLCSTPRGNGRSLNATASYEQSADRRPLSAQNNSVAKIRELEMELRRLLREKTEREREMQALQFERQRLDGRLSHANADRTACLARCALLEQEARDAKHGVDIMQKQLLETRQDVVRKSEETEKRREEKHREQVKTLQAEIDCLQGQIDHKQKELHDTQARILQALASLAVDAETCAKHTDDLGGLFEILDHSGKSTERDSLDEENCSCCPEGNSEFDKQVKRVRHLIKRASERVSWLAEHGVASVQTLQRGLKEMYECRLIRMTHHITDVQDRHGQLLQQVKEHQELEDILKAMVDQKQDDCNQLQSKINEMQEEYGGDSQSAAENQETCMDAMRLLDLASGGTEKEKQILEYLLKQTQCELEASSHALQIARQQLTDERQRVRDEKANVEETCRLLEEKIRSFQENMEQKDAMLAELRMLLENKMTQHSSSTSELRDNLHELKIKFEKTEKELLQKQVQQEELQIQLKMATSEKDMAKRKLQESQEWRQKLQSEVDRLTSESIKMKDTLEELQKQKVSLESESKDLQLSQKDLQYRSGLLEEAVQVLKDDAYCNTETGTPVKTKQLLFEESSERAALEEKVQQLDEENKVLNTSIRTLTEKYKEMVKDLETSLQLETDQRRTMENRFIASEQQHKKTTAQLERAEVLNRDLVESLSLFEAEMTQLKNKRREAETLLATNQQLQGDLKAMEKRMAEQMETAKRAIEEKEKQEAIISELQNQLEEEKDTVNLVREESASKIRELSTMVESLECSLSEHKLGVERVESESELRFAQLSESLRDLQRQLIQEQIAGEKAAVESESQLEHLKATIREYQTRLEEEQMAAEKAALEAQNHADQLQCEIRQHAIANEALGNQIAQLKESFERRLQESMTAEKTQLIEKHKEDLTNVQKALQLDRDTNNVQMAELETKLERAQTYNAQMKEELKKVVKENEKMKHDRRVEMEALEGKVDIAENQVSSLQKQLSDTQREMHKLKQLIARLEADKVELEEKRHKQLEPYVTRLRKMEAEFDEMKKDRAKLEDDFNRVSDERSILEVDKEKQLQQLADAALEERRDFERIIEEMSEKIQQMEEQMGALSGEGEEWQVKYEELYSRVEPFMEQLDAFAAERSLLLGRSELAEAEMAGMMDKYAKLLGHQNQKQKIQYINRLKDEYMLCRKEKEALKEKVAKQQMTIQRLERKMVAGDEKREEKKPYELASQTSKTVANLLRKESSSSRSPLKQISDRSPRRGYTAEELLLLRMSANK